ncbi:MAG TPA: hypothetical protein VKT78_09925 [Fimbriimonadaceae bacterium]|nr:hypothetical protein [Fimbriimonadaceae bacterium]
MNLAISLITALAFTQQAPPAAQTATKTDLTSLDRTYKVGDESSYILSVESDGGPMHLGAKITVKTLSLLDGGKASQELTASQFTGGPDGAGAPEKVTWTFGKDGMAAADFDVSSGNMVYSVISMLSVVPGTITPGKEFKVDWTSPDKASTIKGSGTFEGLKEVNGVKVAVVKTTLEVSPGGQSAATLRNTSNFDPTNGRLVSADGKVELQGTVLTISVKAG